jgi:hypothetical protein
MERRSLLKLYTGSQVLLEDTLTALEGRNQVVR